MWKRWVSNRDFKAAFILSQSNIKIDKLHLTLLVYQNCYGLKHSTLK